MISGECMTQKYMRGLRWRWRKNKKLPEVTFETTLFIINDNFREEVHRDKAEAIFDPNYNHCDKYKQK